MAVEVVLPQCGMGITEGRVSRWLKAVGDEVTEGEVIAEIETAKAVQELTAPSSGTLLDIVVAEATTVPVRAVLAVIG